MAAAIVASNQPQQDNNDDHHHRILKVNDPVILRTCTVDESFRRMEDLVGSEEEEKNWIGIVIALLVIGAILGLIATAIVLVTPAFEKYNPGEPFPFSTLDDESLQLKKPIFSWVGGGDKYVVYVEQEVNTTDNFVERYISLLDPQDGLETTLVPQEILSTNMRNVEAAAASPNTNYALVRLDSETNSISTESTYRIYDRTKRSVSEVSREKLLYASWIGAEAELVYVQNNNIYYKASPYSASTPTAVTTDGSTSLLNGVFDRLYKVHIFPERDSLIWPSPFGSKFLYGKISTNEETSYSSSGDAQPTFSKQKKYKPSLITLHIFYTTTAESKQLDINETTGYLTAVTWMDSDRMLIVWLAIDHKMEKYHICSSTTQSCELNFEYSSAVAQLNWVGLYGVPVYSEENNEYYTLLPDPSNSNRLFRHIAAVKVDKTERHDPGVTFLTSHAWSDLEIITLDSDSLYFLSTGLNITHQHLYRLETSNKISSCLTCADNLTDGVAVATFVKAEFSSTNSYMYLSVLGPDFPTYHVISTSSLSTDQKESYQIDVAHHEGLVRAYKDIQLPIIEYLTVPLDDDIDASVKLILPSIFNRDKICQYELLLIVNSAPGSRIATQEFTLGFLEYLAKNQTYIIALADVRGSAGRGEKVQQSIHARLGTAEAYDVRRIISFLEMHPEHHKVDRDYVAVMGKGYGGFITLHALASQGIRCGIITSPLTSISKHGGWLADRYAPERDTTIELNYNCTEGTTCSVPLSDSLLVIHGMEDVVTSVDNSYSLMRQLQIARYDFRQQIYPDIGNDFESNDVSSHYYQTITNYLNECFEIQKRLDDTKINYCENR